MSMSVRIMLAVFITGGVCAFFLRPTVGIAMVFGLSSTAALVVAFVVAILIGVGMAFGLMRDARSTSSSETPARA